MYAGVLHFHYYGMSGRHAHDVLNSPYNNIYNDAMRSCGIDMGLSIYAGH